MRRAIALLYALCSVNCLILAALNGTMAGVWAGIAAMLAVLVILGYTTMETIKNIAFSLMEPRCGHEKQD